MIATDYFPVVAALLAISAIVVGVSHSLLRSARLRPANCHRARATTPHRLCSRKPDWVPREVLRLKALMPDAGCRKLASTFCSMQQHRKMTVSKSYVATLVKTHQLEIVRLRRAMKHRRPRPMPRNKIWALDLTSISAGQDSVQVLGIIDHGTRACIALRALKTKKSIALLRVLLDAIESYGAPEAIRTDNEAVFTSRLVRFALRMLGVRHQRIGRCAPWQNGRIERFFGTLKERVRAASAKLKTRETISARLLEFRAWYNHVRPHQHLGGRTPASEWNGTGSRPKKKAAYFTAWEGALTGIHIE